MAIQKTRGIILQSRDFTETSKIVNFLTPDWGQLRTLAKGARSPESKLRGKLELLNHGLLIFYPSRTSDLHLLSQFDLLHSFPAARDTLEKTAFFYYLAELAASASYGAEQSRYLFRLLLHVLRKAPAITDLPYAQIWFELKFLHSLGVFPTLNRCSHCGKQLGISAWFSPRERGWLCPDCRSSDPQSIPLVPGLRGAIQYILKGGLERGQKLKLSSPQGKMLRGLIRYLIDSHVNKRLKSLRFLEHIIFPLREKL